MAGTREAGRADALFGQGVVAPVGDEVFEALDGAGEVEVDADEEGFAGAVIGRDGANDLLEVREDGAEDGGEGCHSCLLYYITDLRVNRIWWGGGS